MSQFHKNTTISHPPLSSRPLELAIASIVLTCLAWLVLLIGGDGHLTRLTAFSSKLKFLSEGNNVLLLMLIGLSVGLVAIASAILPSRPRLLMALLLLSFGLSEVVIPWLNLGAFLIRYLVIIVLATVGVLAILRTKASQIGWIRWIALGFLLWCFINIYFNGARLESLLMLPIQLVLVIGVLFGARDIYRTPQMIIDASIIFASVAVLMTSIHLIAFLVFHDSFLKGRFTSILPLPTSFGNSYVLFVAAILWRIFLGGRWLVTGAMTTCLVIGSLLLVLSGTRNALLVMAIVLFVFFFVWKARVALFGGIALTISVLVAVGFFLETTAVRQATERVGNKQSLEIREQVWQFAWEHIQEKPIVGYGLGVGTEVMAQDLPSWNRLNTHNAYLGIWLQLGFVGLVCIIAMYLGGMAAGWRIVLTSGIPREITTAVALPLATLTGLFIGGMFEENLSNRGGLQQVIWGLDICMIQAAWAQLRSDQISHNFHPPTIPTPS